MADRKLRVTVSDLGDKRWEITVSDGDGVIDSSGPLGQLTAMGRVDDCVEVLTRFILHGQVPIGSRKPKVPRAPGATP